MVLTSMEGRTALVVAPHPDDEALGCSGTLKILHEAGTELILAFVTNGEKLHGDPSAEVAEARRKEAVGSARLLGCREPLFLEFPDGEIGGHGEEVFRRLAGIIGEIRPEIVLAPSPIDYHDDHIATSQVALRLLRTSGSFKLAFYEVYSTLRFNCLVDITGKAELKRKAILNYRTSLYGKPEIYADAALGLNAHRSIFLQKKGYYEAFYMVEKAEPVETILGFLCYRDKAK